MSEPNWVYAVELVDVNVDIVADSDDEHGVLKPNELESACGRPYNLWSYGEENVALLAVSILAGIVHNHPFIDGNKRTALVAARTLLVRNGYDIGVSDENLGPLIKEFAAGHLDEADLLDMIEENLIDVG